MRLRMLVLAACVVLLASAASASPIVTLESVPFTTAGHGDPTSLGIVAAGSISCGDEYLGYGCANSAGDFFQRIPGATSDRIDVSTGTFSFSADVVSDASGDAWELGFANIEFVHPSLDQSPSFEMTVRAIVFAVLDVPVLGSDPTTELAFLAHDRIAPRWESAALGEGSELFYGGTNSFLAGDRLTFVEILTFRVSRRPLDGEWTLSTRTPCGSTNHLDTSDCTQEFPAYRPVVSAVPEPGLLWLGGATIALGAASRRGGAAEG